MKVLPSDQLTENMSDQKTLVHIPSLPANRFMTVRKSMND